MPGRGCPVSDQRQARDGGHDNGISGIQWAIVALCRHQNSNRDFGTICLDEGARFASTVLSDRRIARYWLAWGGVVRGQPGNYHNDFRWNPAHLRYNSASAPRLESKAVRH